MPFKKGHEPWNKGKHYKQEGQFKKGNHPKTEFKKGHQGYFKGKKFTEEHKVNLGCYNKGEKARGWKGGITKSAKGYVLILATNHPLCWQTGYIRRSRLIVERQIGRYLKIEEVVHHLGKKDDDRPSRLMAFVNDIAHRKFEKGKSVKPSDIIFDGRKVKAHYGK